MFKNNMKFTRVSCWIDSKIGNSGIKHQHPWHFYIVSTAGDYHKVFNFVELHIFKSLKLFHRVSFHPCNPLLTGNGVEKQCFVVLNVQLQEKLRFRTFYWLLKRLYTAFYLEQHYQQVEIFACPSNKHVIHGLELKQSKTVY